MKFLIYMASLSTLVLFGCKKDKLDYRTSFTGAYSFTEYYSYGGPSTGLGSEVFEHVGFIRMYTEADEQDANSMDNLELPRDQKIVIQLTEDKIAYTQIDNSGLFTNRDEYSSTSGYFKQSGHFSDNRDTVYFLIEMQQGLGWVESEVIGVRQ